MEPKFETIGKRLQTARMAKNLSISEVSLKIGVSRGNLTYIEVDKAKPSSTTLIKLSRLYETTTDWILMGENGIL